MSNRYILWIDDDHQLLDHAINRLRENDIAVKVEPDVDKAIDLIETDRDRIEGVLIDVMMDPGDTLRGKKVEGGFETGYRVLDYLQEKGILAELDVSLFTNAGSAERYYSPSGTDRKIRIARKSRYKGAGLVDFVRSEFFNSNNGGGQSA